MHNRRQMLKTLTAGAVMPWLANTAAPIAAADTPPGRIRIGQLGTSHSHAAGKMESVRSMPELYEIAGIAEPIEGQRQKAEKQAAYAGLQWRTERELLSDDTVSAVIVETTLEDSARAAMACLRAGKHIHLDKPGARSHADFKTMRLEAEKRRLTVQMGFMLRYNPGFELLYRAHREGWLGEITEIHASMGKLADAELRTQLAAIPGHGMFELGCHLVDSIVHLLGEPKAIHAHGTRSGLNALDFPDNQLAVLEYTRVTVTVRCNHADPSGGPHRLFHVVGTKGAIELQPLESGRGVLRLSEAREGFKKGDNSLALGQPKGRYDGEFRDLSHILRGEKSLAWSAAHDIAVHATTLRCAGLVPE